MESICGQCNEIIKGPIFECNTCNLICKKCEQTHLCYNVFKKHYVYRKCPGCNKIKDSCRFLFDRTRTTCDKCFLKSD